MINFLDLKKINNQYRAELIQKSIDLIDSGWYIQGFFVSSFEKNFSTYLNSKYVIGVANGLDALTLILRAYKELGQLKDGDKIIVPANTYIASILAITENKLTPVFVEPELDTYNIDINKIKEIYNSEIKGILNVHLYGRVSWSKELAIFIKETGIICIEDNAQAVGVEYEGVKAGCLGDSAAFSFYPGKNLGCLGDGGAVSTNNEQLANMVRTLANYGSQKKYHNLVQGTNSRLDEIQAGFLSVKLPYLDSENKKRTDIAKRYCSEISNIKLILPNFPNNEKEHVWHLFVIRCENRNHLQNYLIANNVQTMIHYPIPPHKQPAYSEFNNLSLPLTEKIHNEVLSLPISQVLTKEEVTLIIKLLNQY